MSFLNTVNAVISALFFVCYFYQLVYLIMPHIRRDRPHRPAKLHRYAVLIAARNEQAVIGKLIESVKAQDYPSELLSIFVVADNCTDLTARAAKDAGAAVYERCDATRVGKGYALDFLLRGILTERGDVFDAYFVFDADNLLSPGYISAMNRAFSDGYPIVTSYRNSKNFASNRISAGYALWFLREAEYLNHARVLCGHSAAVSGTGFMVSREIIRQNGGWPFHLLTEDIEFTADSVVRGELVGYAPDAVLFDEQPVTFRQSWRQRERWAKGYLRVFAKYGGKLISGAGSAAVLLAVLRPLWNTHFFMLFIGSVTTITQWRSIHASTAKRLLYILTFPIFMLTYIPISISALLKKVEWKPIEHKISMSIKDLV